VRTQGVVILPPRFNGFPGFCQTREYMCVQALIAKAPVETYDEAIVCRFAWADEVQPDPMLVRPQIKCLARELRPVVHPDNLGALPLEPQGFQPSGDTLAGDGSVRLQARTVPIPIESPPKRQPSGGQEACSTCSNFAPPGMRMSANG
jgi:hypothetical protein